MNIKLDEIDPWFYGNSVRKMRQTWICIDNKMDDIDPWFLWLQCNLRYMRSLGYVWI